MVKQQRLARWPKLGFLAVAFALAGLACGPSGPALGSGPGQTASEQRPVPSRVVIANGVDVTALATKLSAGGAFAADYFFMMNSPLVVFDPQGVYRPLLAASIPSQREGTWTVSPDGAMATTWTIRPGALWQDGQPVTSSDFAFALRVYMDDAVEVRSRTPEQLIERIEPLDDQRFVIHWKNIYTLADRLTQGQLEPLPKHIVGPLYESGDKGGFVNAPFWTDESYVGNGPYRIAKWERGIELSYRAFDHYFMGRPKIDQVTIKVITDANTLVSNLLGGAVDVTVGLTLMPQSMAALRDRWVPSGEGVIHYTFTFLANVQIQHDPERAGQRALQDLRVRRALVHALDRATIAEVASEGTSPPADVLMHPKDPLFPRVEREIARYPYDPTRALALLQEAGWTKRGDRLVDASGETFTTDIMPPALANAPALADLVAAAWKEIGIQASITAVPQVAMRDEKYRALFPGFRIYGNRIDVPVPLRDFTTSECARAETRFTGSNGGCWSNPEYDRFYRIVTTNLDPQTQADAIVGMFVTLTREVGAIPLIYYTEPIAVRKGLEGPGSRWSGQNGTTWNVYDWHWR